MSLSLHSKLTINNISVVQDIISSSKKDSQQTIVALFDMFPKTNTVEERPSEEETSYLWKIPLVASKFISLPCQTLCC